LCQTDARPIWTNGTILTAKPFTVEIDARWACPLQAHSKLVIIHDGGRCIAKGESQIQKSVPRGHSANVLFADFEWEIAESRDHPRFNIEEKATIRSIRESDTEIDVLDQVATTQNISLGGALVKVGKPVQLGDLVEFRMAWGDGSIVKALGVVAHANEEGTLLGLNFIEYSGASREDLNRILSGIAA